MHRFQSESSTADQPVPGFRLEPILSRNGLLFPLQSRARLDSSLDEVVIAARRVLATQTRLRQLIEANRSVAQHQDRSALLYGILYSAVALVGATSGEFEMTATRHHPHSLVRCGTEGDRPPEIHTRELRLLDDGVTLGLLCIGRDSQHDFSAEDDQLLESFCAMAAIAITNYGLRERVEAFDSASADEFCVDNRL